MSEHTELRAEATDELERMLKVLPERTLRALALLRHADDDVREHALAVLPLGSRTALAALKAAAYDDVGAALPEVQIRPLGQELIEASANLFPNEALHVDPTAVLSRIAGEPKVVPAEHMRLAARG